MWFMDIINISASLRKQIQLYKMLIFLYSLLLFAHFDTPLDMLNIYTVDIPAI